MGTKFPQKNPNKGKLVIPPPPPCNEVLWRAGNPPNAHCNRCGCGPCEIGQHKIRGLLLAAPELAEALKELVNAIEALFPQSRIPQVENAKKLLKQIYD